MPQKYYDLYDPAEIELPPNFQPEHPFDTGALRIRDEMLAAFPRDPEEIRRHIHEYYAMISHLDAAVGRILDALEKTGEADNTLILFSSDNGLAVGQHGLMGKQNLYDHSVRVPLIFSGPGVPEGRQVSDLVYLQDIFPTLSEMLHVPAPESLQGQSFASAFATGQEPQAARSPREALYLAYADSIRGLTTGRYKLIEYAAAGTQLFDLEQDPWEQNNLVEDPAHADLLQKLRRQLTQMARDQETPDYHNSRGFWESRPDLPDGIC
jgi:arylsulfatase A-like enzyme